ncbi:iron ABC transporter permease [Thalassotalea mangrovi]|uniref:Iron ABC transporter permease n=2 Tax=Thalassotalea mangrovi TaxID=2572245 RepID=A0A4U1B201_9GAMM|nr:iron ABC transporter permease [Thalassotalea mangrovi]
MESSQGIFAQLADTVLFDYISNSILMVIGVCLISLLIGLPLAWLVAMCKFPGKRFFSWALVLPLAMPAYIVAYIYSDFFDYAGPVQIWLRNTFGWQSPADYWFFDIRSIPGASVILALVLYPYVYLFLRSAFAQNNLVQMQASRLLGDTPWQSFWRISIPQARGIIVASLALVGMETLADFATMHYFAINTMTTAVYDTWLGYYNLPAAAKLSVLMLAMIFLLLAIEKRQRIDKQNYSRNDSFDNSEMYQLSGGKAWLATGFASLVLFAGFILPSLVLCGFIFDYYDQVWSEEFIEYGSSSLFIALIAAVLAVIVALIINFGLRQSKQTNQLKHTWIQPLPGQLASMGYALPGTVLAIGIIIPMTALEFWSNDVLVEWFDWQPGLFLTGTTFAIIFAYVVRFSAIPIGSVQESMSKISPHLDHASRSMGAGFSKTALRIHLPLLKRILLTSGLLVFIESMKELPAALLLRPFGFETLATYVYQYVSDEQLEHASLAALSIVILGLIPLLIVNRMSQDSLQKKVNSNDSANHNN